MEMPSTMPPAATTGMSNARTDLRGSKTIVETSHRTLEAPTFSSLDHQTVDSCVDGLLRSTQETAPRGTR